MSTTLLGILLGLAAATCQSVTYLQSRHFVGHASGGRRRLMLLGHVIQGVIGLAVLPILWPAEMPALRQYVFPLLMSAGGFLVGQAFLFSTLRHIEASRVAPFLSIKIAMLATLAWKPKAGNPSPGTTTTLTWKLCLGGQHAPAASMGPLTSSP